MFYEKYLVLYVAEGGNKEQEGRTGRNKGTKEGIS